MIPNNVMLQEFIIFIKPILNNLNINFMNPVSIDEFEKIERYLWNQITKKQSKCNSNNESTDNDNKTVDKSLMHIHLSHDDNQDDEKCYSSDLQYIFSYARNYIIFDSKNKKVIDNEIYIPVFKCSNCEHYHALLPSIIIVPYCQYSLFFILSALFAKKYSSMTINEIAQIYQISISTLYRWEKRFSVYIRCYEKIRGHLNMDIFVALIVNHIAVIDKIYESYSRTLMQTALITDDS